MLYAQVLSIFLVLWASFHVLPSMVFAAVLSLTAVLGYVEKSSASYCKIKNCANITSFNEIPQEKGDDSLFYLSIGN